MTACKCRYDAAGHKILPRADMQLYYKDDKKSTEIVANNMPHRYVCYPDITIRIFKKDCTRVVVTWVYPGETIEKEIELTERALEGLRNTWAKGKAWGDRKNGPDTVSMRYRGCVKLDPKRRYGIWG